MAPLFNPPETKVKIRSVSADYQALSDDGTILVDPAQISPVVITWDNLTNAVDTAGSITKVAPGTSTAGSLQFIAATDDGYCQFTALQNDSQMSVGMSISAFSPQSDVAFFLKADGHYAVVEDIGVDLGTYAANDVFRIERTSGVVLYKKNGATVYTSSSSQKLFSTCVFTNADDGTGVSTFSMSMQGATITLPTMANAYNSTEELGQCITIYRLTDRGTLTVSGGASDIEGSSTVSITEVDNSITVQPDGTDWFLVSAGSLSNIGTTYIRDGIGRRALDIGGSAPTARQLLDQKQNCTVDWNTWVLIETVSSPTGSTSVDWGFRNLLDVNGDIAFDWNDALAPIMAYAPTTPGDWSPAPLTVAEALDQLAARVKALEP